MAKASKDKSDGLEIVSIGKLYTGPWEKKYWSCSRGKDRYPYPVGFNAVRSQNGITYRMEIFEGLKGPLFTISSTDGLSCSGQTPDIAWESFQKKGCSQPKLWRGKRFSCKIDGTEFFGFKNAFVQRLLRELVANVSGAVEQNLLPSLFCDEASKTGDPIPETDLSTCPDLLLDLEKPALTRKRSRKEKMITVHSKNVAGFRKAQTRAQGKITDASNSRQSCQDQSSTYSANISSSYQEDFDNKAKVLRGSENLGPEDKDENMLVSAENESCTNYSDGHDHPKVDRIYEMNKIKLTSCRNYTVLEDGNLPKDKEIVNYSITEDEDGERLGQSNMKIINDSQLCAPDTFDLPPDMAISEVLKMESYPEDDTDTGSSYLSSEKPDSDSVGQEIANSMMTVLLPRALPLLKTFSRREKKKLKPLEKSKIMSMDENKKTVAVLSPGRGLKETSDLNQNKEDADISGVPKLCADKIESVVPHSFDNDGSDNPFSKKFPLFPGIMVEEKSPVDPENCRNESILESVEGPSSCHLGATDSKTELVPNVGPLSVDDAVTKSSIEFTFPCKRDTFVNFSKNTLFVGLQTPGENAKTWPDYIEGIFDPANSCQEEYKTCVSEDLAKGKDIPELDRSISDWQNQAADCSIDTAQRAKKKEVEDGSELNDNVNQKHGSELQDVLKIVACYIHPVPILVVLLSTVGNNIYLCLLCGSVAQEDKILFVYNAPINGDTAGRPSFVGQSRVIVPFLKDSFGRNIALENSGLQFTPDAQSLVLADSIKVPCCREGNIHCPCASCTSECFGDNGLKIVQVKVEYVLVVSKLKTAQIVRCLLVCAPNHLLAADNSGKLYLWVMNSRWSGHVEECHLLMPDHMSSILVELKRIPKSAALVVGHNGFGEFGLWNIEKRILVSKFSAPGTSISKCIPISLFQWQRNGSFCTYSNPRNLIHEVLDATKMSFSGSTEKKLALPIDSKEMAIWLLISTISDPDLEHGYQSGDLHIDAVGCWRLALLVKDIVIMGSTLDHRAAVIGALSSHGIIGRSDGQVYMWEFSTGIKVGNLHNFRGTGVSCIATDSSNSGALAVASEEGQLLVYMHDLESSAKCQC